MGAKDQIGILVTRYFSQERATFILKYVNYYAERDDQILFFQIIQEGNDLKFETAINRPAAIFDLVFGIASLEHCILRYDDISFIKYRDDDINTALVIISSGSPNLKYVSNAPQSREMLRTFFNIVVSLHERRGES